MSYFVAAAPVVKMQLSGSLNVADKDIGVSRGQVVAFRHVGQAAQ
jgi:hypothetical protein